MRGLNGVPVQGTLSAAPPVMERSAFEKNVGGGVAASPVYWCAAPIRINATPWTPGGSGKSGNSTSDGWFEPAATPPPVAISVQAAALFSEPRNVPAFM